MAAWMPALTASGAAQQQARHRDLPRARCGRMHTPTGAAAHRACARQTPAYVAFMGHLHGPQDGVVTPTQHVRAARAANNREPMHRSAAASSSTQRARETAASSARARTATCQEGGRALAGAQQAGRTSGQAHARQLRPRAPHTSRCAGCRHCGGGGLASTLRYPWGISMNSSPAAAAQRMQRAQARHWQAHTARVGGL